MLGRWRILQPAPHCVNERTCVTNAVSRGSAGGKGDPEVERRESASGPRAMHPSLPCAGSATNSTASSKGRTSWPIPRRSYQNQVCRRFCTQEAHTDRTLKRSRGGICRYSQSMPYPCLSCAGKPKPLANLEGDKARLGAQSAGCPLLEVLLL